MSGRGRGRGRGGGGHQPTGMIKGATWDFDPDLKIENKPQELYPPHPNIKKLGDLTDREKRAIKYYKALQTQIHRGPLYTQPTKRDPDGKTKTFSEDQFNAQYGSNKKADMDPFLGVETYSMRYAPKKNEIPKLSGRPFNKELFPQELWSTLDGKEGDEVRSHVNRAVEKKTLMLSANADPSLRAKRILEKIHRVAGEEDDADEPMENPYEEEREVDDEFDDDELGEDYNAEIYFDGGDGDSAEEDGGGGGDDYDG